MKRMRFIIPVSFILACCLIFNIGVASANKPEPTGYNQALVNVCDYGAIPNDGKDDTLAFQITLMDGKMPVYVPPGIYNISQSLIVSSSSLMGAGIDKTVIIADMVGVREPIIWAGDRSQIRDLTIKFADNCVNKTEVSGERVGIITSSKGERRLCRGAAVSNVKIENVGTGIYSPLAAVIKKYQTSAGITNSDHWSGDASAFSVTFEGITVKDFSFRGISMEATGRTGNVWRNIYLSSGKYTANTAFYFTEDSEASIFELTIADSKLKNGFRIKKVPGVQITNFNVINTELVEDNTAFLYCDEACVTVNGFTLKNSAPKNDKQAFIRLGNASYYGYYYFPTNGFLHIYNMNILNPKLDTYADPEAYMISRRNAYFDEYTVNIDNLRVVAPESVKKIYEDFNYDKREINLTVNGVKK